MDTMRFLSALCAPDTYFEVSTLTAIICTDTADIPSILETYKNDNIYVLGCVPKKGVVGSSRTTKNGDITKKNYVFFDIDIRKEYPEYTDMDIIDEGMRIQEVLETHALFSTWSYIIFSGNGIHIYYIGESTPVSADTYARGYTKVARELSTLIGMEVDEQCKNLARISRLPGSFNNKNGKHTFVYPIAERNTISTMTQYVMSQGKRDTVSVEDVLSYVKATPVFELCTLFRIETTPKGEVIMDGQVTSARINPNGNYVNRFSGKGGSGDFISLYREVYKTEFIETCKIIADRIFHKDVALTEQETVLESREHIKKDRRERHAKGYVPLIWNTPKLDAAFPVIKPYSYIVLAGKTKSGKSTFVFDLAHKNADRGKKVMYFTLEMTKDQMIDNLCRTAAGITPLEERYYLEHLQYPNEKEIVYQKRKEQLHATESLMIVGKELSGSTTIVSILDSVLSYPDIDLLIIDNLDKVDGLERQDDISRQKYISNTLVYFTNEYQIPTFLIHHFRKADPKDKGLFPPIDSLSGSSKISHDADATIFVAREQGPDDEFTSNDTYVRVMATREFEPVTRMIHLHNGIFQDIIT